MTRKNCGNFQNNGPNDVLTTISPNIFSQKLSNQTLSLLQIFKTLKKVHGALYLYAVEIKSSRLKKYCCCIMFSCLIT